MAVSWELESNDIHLGHPFLFFKKSFSISAKGAIVWVCRKLGTTMRVEHLQCQQVWKSRRLGFVFAQARKARATVERSPELYKTVDRRHSITNLLGMGIIVSCKLGALTHELILRAASK